MSETLTYRGVEIQFDRVGEAQHLVLCDSPFCPSRRAPLLLTFEPGKGLADYTTGRWSARRATRSC